MDIYDKQIEDVTIITIDGNIDTLTAPRIMKHIKGLISNGKARLVVDFSAVDYTSSAGLRVLLGTVKETRAKGGDLFLFDVQPDVERVLSLSGFTSILEIVPDIDTAVNKFS
ncbi:MAG: STAS domain-containing protein [Anaerolineae bacterium]|jgi:anti-sigma B factor antagonist|nr:STAS domain-containing protein [Anaerolineae bacterium]MBT4311962.1 STAS domain-containing protein [Anaerolineae bacterium]MBT4459362.1 STAS domain-containing protein [Anaerolineae bacterium]MBT4841264.1 STAS domain-containing protein [Anaerolineae bacterium]MBT6060556.1 STAS domain-containing protein [Anaerolineae bacterium]